MSDSNVERVRAEVRAWLGANWDADLSLAEWRRRLVASGWGCPTWPEAWFGKGHPPELAEVVESELRSVGAVGVAQTGVRTLAAATLLEHGSDEQKRRLLPGMLTGEDTWCQLFSEPGSGSDLAGLTTRAELDGDTWMLLPFKLLGAAFRLAAGLFGLVFKVLFAGAGLLAALLLAVVALVLVPLLPVLLLGLVAWGLFRLFSRPSLARA